jgi:hypothetical protein
MSRTAAKFTLADIRRATNAAFELGGRAILRCNGDIVIEKAPPDTLTKLDIDETPEVRL